MIEVQSPFNMNDEVLGKNLGSTLAHDTPTLGRESDVEACLDMG